MRDNSGKRLIPQAALLICEMEGVVAISRSNSIYEEDLEL